MNNDTPFRAPESDIWSVSEITTKIQNVLENSFSDVWVQGEISEFTRASSGHIYLSLKDEEAVLRGIIWRSLASRIKFNLEEGLEIVARGNIDVYPPRGRYQLIIRELQPKGVGELQLAFKQLLDRLEKEGLFAEEHKKPLPCYPEKIGIITSPTGAAVRDMIRVIERRWAPADIYLLPRRVQGEGAAEEIAAGLFVLNDLRGDLDLIIIGRGGGSLEDLWAFNEEVLARAIFDSEIPVVSAVGHEVDFTISDFVADMRVATPTEAGEQTVPAMPEIKDQLQNLAWRAARALTSKGERARQHLKSLAGTRALRHPEDLIEDRAQKADDLFHQLNSTFSHQLEMSMEKTRALGGRLNALSPLRVLERGYSITFDEDGNVLRSTENIKTEDIIRTQLHEGTILSRLFETRTRETTTDQETTEHGKT
ncbi:MAG: exodeoxyribonuclease VII large subunit [Candidatus Brocadiia bacterium]